METSKVSALRDDKFKCVDKRRPGFYRWWFKKEAAQSLIKDMDEWLTDNDRFLTREFDDGEYVALYFGISTDMRGRIRWHANQKHTSSTVSKGFLSTLRQTLSALLGSPMSESYQKINEFIDENCIWEWAYTDTPEEARQIELETLSPNSPYYYPLNVEANHTIHKDAVIWLKEKRKEHKH